jgi:hypothetical protein
MAKNKISEYSATASNNTDIGGINIAEGCAPSGINNAIRELMAQLKDQQAGTDADGFVVGGAFTSSGGAVFSSGTTFSGSVVMSSTVGISGVASLTGSTNNIGTTTSATILSGSVTQTSGSVLYLDAAATTSAAPPLSWSGDTNTGIYRPAADTLALVTGGSDRLRIGSTGIVNVGGAVVIGSGDATTSVAGSILRGPSSAGTNIAGGDIEIQAGNGTGTGGSGNIVLKTADVGSSGSTANTLTQRLLITPKGGFSFGGGATSYGTAGQVLKSNGDAPPSFGTVGPTSATAKSASGSSIDFTDIPATAKRVTVLIRGVSLSGTGDILIRLGTASEFVATGYIASTSAAANGGTTSITTSTLGFPVYSNAATRVIHATMTLHLVDTNYWLQSHILQTSTSAINGTGAGTISLSEALTSIRITTLNGTTVGGENFDAGTVNIFYE